jgi:hypothetical protein
LSNLPQVLVNLTLAGLVFGSLLVISVGKHWHVQKKRFNDAAGSLVIVDAFNRWFGLLEGLLSEAHFMQQSAGPGIVGKVQQ